METGPQCSMRDLLQKQATAAEHLLAISREIGARAGDGAATAGASLVLPVQAESPGPPWPQPRRRSVPALTAFVAEGAATAAEGPGLLRLQRSSILGRPRRRTVATVGPGSLLGGAPPPSGGPAALAEPLLGRAPPPSHPRALGAGGPASERRKTSLGRSRGQLWSEFARERGSRGVFPDLEVVKEHVRKTLNNGSYDVEARYHTTGFWQAVARNGTFKHITLLVIVLNSVYIAIDTDYNKADDIANAAWQFQLAENMFSLFFTLELAARFMAFVEKRDALHDGWFLFDGLLVMLMDFHTWFMPMVESLVKVGDVDAPQGGSIFRALKLIRLARLGRMFRLLKDLPELMMLARGMVCAIRAVFSTLCLLLMAIYVFAIVFTQTLNGSPAATGCFETVPQSMHCLMINGVFADQASIIRTLLDEHWTYYAVILVYLVIASMVLLNMLIGVMCEVIQVVAGAEKEALMAQTLKDKVATVVTNVVADGGSIDPVGFSAMIHDPDLMEALVEAEIDVFQLVEFADCIFDGKEAIGFDRLVEELLQFRSDKRATVADLIASRRLMVAELGAMLWHGGAAPAPAPE